MAGGQGTGHGFAVPEAASALPEWESPSEEDVRVTAVSAHGWRVSDERLPLRDPLRLLAYIERRGDAFEVLQLGAGFEWHVFDSMDEAVAFAVATGPRVARSRTTARGSSARIPFAPGTATTFTRP